MLLPLLPPPPTHPPSTPTPTNTHTALRDLYARDSRARRLLPLNRCFSNSLYRFTQMGSLVSRRVAVCRPRQNSTLLWRQRLIAEPPLAAAVGGLKVGVGSWEGGVAAGWGMGRQHAAPGPRQTVYSGTGAGEACGWERVMAPAKCDGQESLGGKKRLVASARVMGRTQKGDETGSERETLAP